MAKEASGTLLMKPSPELEVTLATETKLFGGVGRPIRAALSFHEHGQLERNVIVRVNGQRTIRAYEGLWWDLELHGKHLLGVKSLGRKIAEVGSIV